MAALLHARGFHASRQLLDHYRTLGLQYNAGPKDIKDAFLKLAKRHHPDANPDDATAVAKFQSIAEAHGELSDGGKKLLYDQSIGNDFRRPSEPRAEWRPRRGNITAPRPTHPGGRPVDTEAWNAWHYGDENGEYSRESTIDTSRRSRDKNATRTNKWFKRRNVRSHEERQEAAALNAIRDEKDNVVRRMRERREARRSGTKAAAEGCAIS
mmetsp:Transcript_21204/g.73240  ORF Transcript_21204/g.73240 Transcript_21204/m.73240 type:complete len:211 (+) Transcript_21204:149-781(+)